jgi:hypothetical protein
VAAMGSALIVVPPGEGHLLGNVEFLARTIDTPRFNLSRGFDRRIGLPD